MAKIKGIDGKSCWTGYRYAGTENGKDKCVKVEVIEEGKMCEVCALALIKDIQSGMYNDTIVEAEYRGKKVKLNKPIRTPKTEPGKFKVYVKLTSVKNFSLSSKNVLCSANKI